MTFKNLLSAKGMDDRLVREFAATVSLETVALNSLALNLKELPMPKKKTPLDRFSDLTWNDMEEWAGNKILSRGKSYQRQGRVSDLAVTEEGSLIAWVDGTERYATEVIMHKDGPPDSTCTCPYELDCKHGVALVIEYLERVQNNQKIPKAMKDDDRLELLGDKDRDDEPMDDENVMPEETLQDIDSFLKGKTKAQLIELIHDLAGQYPEIAKDLFDQKLMTSGNIKTLVTRLKNEIREIADEPGWQNYWEDEGYTPDCPGIRKKLDALLKAGHADEVVALGQELVTTGTRLVEESHYEGETAMEIVECMPLIAKALDQSSLEPVDKLIWALDALLKDQFDLCEVFAEYLHRRHPKSAWQPLADLLLARLEGMKNGKGTDDFSSNYERDRLSDWAIHALERASRKNEVIPLCETEARKTGSYVRLVERLVQEHRYEDAEKWIKQGIRDIGEKWPGTAASLRNKLQKIRTLEKSWPAVGAIQVEDFVRHPSQQAFTDCKKACGKAKVWPKVREYLLTYLEKGDLPWKKKGWPLPKSGLDAPETERKDRFPLVGDLINIAILEKKPDQVLHWYDRLSQKRFGCYGINDDEVATAVQTYAPDQAVAIWKRKAEGLIAQVKLAHTRRRPSSCEKPPRSCSGRKKQQSGKAI